MEIIIADNERMLKDLRRENTSLKLEKQSLSLMPTSEGFGAKGGTKPPAGFPHSESKRMKED